MPFAGWPRSSKSAGCFPDPCLSDDGRPGSILVGRDGGRRRDRGLIGRDRRAEPGRKSGWKGGFAGRPD